MNTHLTIATMATLGIAAVFTAAPANAAVQTRRDFSQAVEVCQPATFTVSRVRNRPFGVRNESTGPLYMTCAMKGDDMSARGGYRVFLRVGNQGTTSATVNCTMLDGSAFALKGTYPQSLTVPAGGTEFFSWVSADLGSGASWDWTSFSCLLQPNVEIQYMGKEYLEEVGA